MRGKRIGAANWVTISRVALSLVLFALLMVPIYVSYESLVIIPETHFTVLDLVCFVLFIVLSSTDSVDGHLARSRNEVTNLGKVLDPLADKLLVDGTMIILSVRAPMLLPPVFCVLFIARDLLVDGLRIMSASKGKIIPANMWGKVKTVLEMSYLPVVILRGFPLNFVDWATSDSYSTGWLSGDPWSYDGELAAMIFCLVLGLVTLVFSIVSGIIYLYQGRDLLNEGLDRKDRDSGEEERKLPSEGVENPGNEDIEDGADEEEKSE